MTDENVRAILRRFAMFEDDRPVECLLLRGTPKICYATEGKAKSAAKEMIDAGLEPARRYQCPGCLYWHLATANNRRRRWLRRVGLDT